MRTLLTETAEIDAHLHHTMPPGDSLVFQARTIIDPQLRDKIEWQRQTYQLVQHYGRKQLRSEIEAVHQKLFTGKEHTSFRQRVLRLFNR